MSLINIQYGSGFVVINKYWSDFLTVVTAKSLLIQYEQDSTAYYIFAIDNDIIYTCTLYTGTVPDPVNYSQVTNDANLATWNTTYKSSAGAKTQESTTVTGTVTTTGTSTVSGTVAATQSGTWNINSITTLPALPTGSNTIGTVNIGTSSLALDATLSTMSGKLPASVGQKIMTGSLPVVIASDQIVPISGTVGAITAAIDYTDNVRNILVDSVGHLLVNLSNSSVLATNTLTGTANILTNCQFATYLNFKISNTNSLVPWTGTILFESTVDNGSTWVALNVLNLATGLLVTSATSNGNFAIANNGYDQVRVRGNTVTNSATIIINQSVGPQFITQADKNTSGSITSTQSISVNSQGCGTVAIGITGTWTGTLVFEVTIDNNNWISHPAINLSFGATVTSTTVNGNFELSSGGYQQVRVRGNTVGSGTANIILNAAASITSISLDSAVFGAGTAGTADSRVLTVQGISGGTPIPVSGTFSATNPSVGTINATVPTSGILNGGSDGTFLRAFATDSSGRLNIGTGTAGSPTSNVVTVQGISGGTNLPVSISNTPSVNQSGTWTVGLSTGSNTIGIVNQGTAASLANAWLTKITDGTNTAAVKAASTAAVAGDQSLVVQISPNSPGLNISAPNTSGAGTLNGLNAVVNISLTNVRTVGFQLAAGTLVGTITAQMSIDGSNWTNTFFDLGSTSAKQQSIVFSSSNTAITGTIVGVGGAVQTRVIVTAYTSGSASITLSGVQLNDPSLLCAGPAGIALPPTVMSIGGTDGTLSRIIATDKSGRVLTTTASPISSVSGTQFGFLVQAATTTSQVMSTVYTEQTTNGQRSFRSANAADTAAGTGARTVQIIYYDQAMAGPFTETVTLNGTTAVNTVATNICFICDLAILTAGSGGVAAGIISLYTATGGGGSVFASIAAGQIQTNWAHHYVGNSVICNITTFTCANSGNTATHTLRAKSLSGTFYTIITDTIYQTSTTSSTIRNYTNTIRVVGPARVVAYVTPNASGSATYYASFDYFDV